MSLSSLNTAASGLQANQDYLSVVANNLANLNTAGFKGGTADFEDALSQTLVTPSGSPDGNAIQIGEGTELSAVSTNYSQGALQSTGVGTDVAINGGGFFVVKDPTSGKFSYTRDGSFSVDANGYLLTATGQRVQGDTTNPPKTGDALSDIQIPTTVGGVAVSSFTIDNTGQVTAQLQDGTTSVVGTLTLQNFSNQEGLLKVGDNLYQGTIQSGAQYGTAAAPTFAASQQGSLGSLQVGYVEQSNVDLSDQFTNMILAERSLQANAQVVTASDQVLQSVINMSH